MPLSLAEDPFNPETDANKPPRVRGTFAIRSAQFYGHGDAPLLVPGRFYDGKNHKPLRPQQHALVLQLHLAPRQRQGPLGGGLMKPAPATPPTVRMTTGRGPLMRCFQRVVVEGQRRVRGRHG